MEKAKCGSCGAEIPGQASACPQCGAQAGSDSKPSVEAGQTRATAWKDRIIGFFKKALQSMKADYQAGGLKKLARNKYFIGACVLLVVFIVGSMQDSGKTTTEAGPVATTGKSSTTEATTLGEGDVPKEFLDSVVVTRYVDGRPVADFGTSFTVGKMLTRFVNTKLHDGSYPKCLKWKTSSETYTLPAEFGGHKVYLIFDHQQGAEWSVFKMKTPDGTAVEDEATQIIMTLKLNE